MATKTERKTHDKLVEIHVTEFLGIPIVRKYVTESSKVDKHAEASTEGVHLVPQWLKAFVALMMLISVCACLGILYRPPRVLHELTDSFLMGNTKRVEDLQERLGKSELDKASFKEGLDKCLSEKAAFIKNLDEAEEKCNKRTKVLEESNQHLLELNENLRKQAKREQEFLRKVDEMKGNLTFMKRQIDEILRNEAELKETVQERDQFLRKQIKLIKEQKLGDEQKLNELETLKRDCEEQLGELREKNDNEKQQMDKKQTECESARHEVERELENKNEIEKGLNLTIEDLQSNVIPELHQNISELKEDLNAERKSKVSEVGKLIACKATLVACEGNNYRLSTDVNKLKKTISSLDKGLAGEREEKRAVTEELNRSKLALGKCKNKNFDHENGNAQLLEENGRLRKQLEKC